MSQQVKDLFKALLTEDEDVFRDRSLDFPDDEEGSFESGLDADGEASDFDTEGLGFDPEEVSEANFAEVYGKVTKIDEMVKDLVDPNVPNNLTTLLSQHDRQDSIGNGLLQKLEKPILKASQSLSEVKIMLDQIASMEDSLKRRIEALKAK